MSIDRKDLPTLAFAGVVFLLSISIALGGIGEAARVKSEMKDLERELRDAAEAYEEAYAPKIVNLDLLLDEIRKHESVSGTKLFGDPKLGRCGQSVGEYHMLIPTLEWLRKTGRVIAPRGCEAQRKWLLDPANARYAAGVYLRLLLERTGDIDLALCLYNYGHNSEVKTCIYSGKVREGIST